MFLKMCKAEADGLIEIEVELERNKDFMKNLYDFISSDNYTEIADAWNMERKDVVDMAMVSFRRMFNKSLKEELKKACETEVQKSINENFTIVCIGEA